MDLAQIQDLDEIAMHAVPALEVREIDGWSARLTPGISTRRVNSVLARGDGDQALARRLEAVERFYTAAGADARFQLTPASRPSGLRDLLLDRGYLASEPTSVQACSLVGEPVAVAGDVLIQITPDPGFQWWATWRAALAVAPGRSGAVQELFDRIDRRCAFVTVSAIGQNLAVGMGVLDGEWVGIFNMATVPAHRRRGGASAALAVLMSWARSEGARGAYLQVSLDNAGALRLYERSGFDELYRYEYLTRRSTRL